MALEHEVCMAWLGVGGWQGDEPQRAAALLDTGVDRRGSFVPSLVGALGTASGEEEDGSFCPLALPLLVGTVLQRDQVDAYAWKSSPGWEA